MKKKGKGEGGRGKGGVRTKRGMFWVLDLKRKRGGGGKLTFFFEGKMLGQMTALVVTPQHEKSFRVVDLVGIQKKDTLNGKQSTINVIAKEEVLNVFRIATHFKELQKIIKLTMNISTN